MGTARALPHRSAWQEAQQLSSALEVGEGMVGRLGKPGMRAGLGQVPALRLAVCVTLGTLLNLSELSFLICEMGSVLPLRLVELNGTMAGMSRAEWRSRCAMLSGLRVAAISSRDPTGGTEPGKHFPL